MPSLDGDISLDGVGNKWPQDTEKINTRSQSAHVIVRNWGLMTIEKPFKKCKQGNGNIRCVLHIAILVVS